MLAFDVHKRSRIRLERWTTIDMWEDTYLGVGAFLDETAHRSSIFRQWCVSLWFDGMAIDAEQLQE